MLLLLRLFTTRRHFFAAHRRLLLLLFTIGVQRVVDLLRLRIILLGVGIAAVFGRAGAGACGRGDRMSRAKLVSVLNGVRITNIATVRATLAFYETNF